MEQLVTRSELARIARVTPGAITQAAARWDRGALVGPRVDLSHPDVQRYLARREVDQTRVAVQGPDAMPPPTVLRPVPALHEAHLDTRAEDIEQYAHWTLEALVRKFGTATAFNDWLDARKRISDIREKDLKADEREGRLVSREYVRVHVFSHLEAANRRLLQDAPATIARRLYAAAKSGMTVEEAEELVRELISSQLKPAKDAATKALKDRT